MSVPEDLSLRQATSSDLLFLIQLRRITMYRVVMNHGSWHEDVQRDRVVAHFEFARIIQWRGRDVGLFKVVDAENEVELVQIQILPEFQCKGIGTQLVTKLQEECADAGKPITLCVLHSNPAFALYARLGFEVIGSDSHLHTMRWTPKGPR
jgi:ribosomal protein S18 acetylase RimI-like enzyme